MSKREREPWGRFAAKAGVLGVCICLAIGYLSDRYRIGRDPQIVRSLGDYTTFLVDRYRSEARRGEIVAFRAQGLTQYWFNRSTGACAEMTVGNGRYQSVRMLPAEDC